MNGLLLKIPDEYKPWAAIGIGGFMLVCLVLFHGLMLHRIHLTNKRGERRLLSRKPHLLAAAFLFCWVVSLMLVLHIVEILMWAFAIERLGLVPHVHDAIYFCANAYTTMGYGSVDLEKHWRNISPIIGMSGLFTFAWTTSFAVDAVGT